MSNHESVTRSVISIFEQKTRHSGSYQVISVSTVATIRRADKKLTFIPVVFILLRIWGTIQFFYASGVAHLTYFSCVPNNYGVGFTFLAYVQVCSIYASLIAI